MAEAVVDIAYVLNKIAEHKGCGTSSDDGKASCGSSDGPADMAPEIWEKVKNGGVSRMRTALRRTHLCP